MNKKLHSICKTLLWLGMLSISFSTFSQTFDEPYNIVMNIYDDPTTKMAFNWFTKNPFTAGQVEIVKGTLTQHSEFNTPYKITISANPSNLPVNKAVVTGLSPGTTYSFRVGGVNGYWSNIGRFTTAQASKAPFTFIYTTDPQPADSISLITAQNTTQKAFTKYDSANFWLHCGDMVEHGKDPDEWKQFFATQREHFLRFPFAPVQGNHDAQSNVNFRQHFNTENFGSYDLTGSTYTFIYGDAQFFALNGEKHGDAQYINAVKKWMRNCVNAHSDNIKWRIVYNHKGLYTGGSHQSDTIDMKWRNYLTPLFDELRIDVVFQGHNHVYEVIGPVFDKQLVPGSVSDVQHDTPHFQYNVSGNSGGIFDVSNGTLYFTNGASGSDQKNPTSFLNMPNSTITGVPDYPSLFSGRFGNKGNPTYSHVSVSTDSIVITTYEIINETSSELDKIKVVKCCNIPNCEPCTHAILTYTDNQSLSNAHFVITNELRIKNNATVTFTNSTLRFYKDAKVIIEPGGKLIIDGGTLTNACPNTMWQGITVLGDNRYSGSVQVINNGTIENAIIGIDVKARGAVTTNNANFINNPTGVLFEYQSGGGMFTLTNFKVNNNTRFVAHIKAQNSGAVKVIGCTFLGIGGGYGIWANNANLEVKEYCSDSSPTIGNICPVNYREPSSFSGFSTGIYHISGGNLPTLKVHCSKFEDCKDNIYIGATNYPEILVNRFDITRDEGHGIFIRYSTGYKIEENTFTDSKSASGKTTTGMLIDNSGIDENEVYKNQYENLHIGQTFSFQNSSQTDTVPCPNCPHNIRGAVTGVQTLCNVFEQNYSKDIFVPLSSSIRKDQGSSKSPAGNTFNGTPMNIDNFLSQHPIDYYCRNSNNEIPLIFGNINRNITTSVNGCPSKIGLIYVGGGNTKGEGDLEQYLAQYNKWNTEYEYWLAQLLKFENEQGEEYQKVLNQVSYFSALKDNYFNAIIVAVMGTEGDEAESRRQKAEGEKDRNNYELRITNYEMLRFLFNYRGHYSDNLCVVESYLAESNFGEALVTLAKMYEKFELTSEQVNEVTGLRVYVYWLQQLEKEGKNIYELSEKELDYLVNFVKTNTGRGVVFAHNILCGLYEICIEDEMIRGLDDKTIRGLDDKTIKGLDDKTIKGLDDKIDMRQSVESESSACHNMTLVPNPTTGQLTINNEQLTINNIEIFDVYGKRHQSICTLVHSSTITMDISHLSKGLYFVRVTTENGIFIEKIIKN